MNEVITEFSLCEQGILLSFTLIAMGQDSVILVSGGDVPHIGALTAADSDSEESSTTVFRGHREDVITKLIQEKLKEYTAHKLCVIGGVHIDHITREQIALVIAMCHHGAEQIGMILRSRALPPAHDCPE